MNGRFALFFAVATLLGGAACADSAKLYRWTDSDGHVHYSDRVPPEAAHAAHQQLDAHGQPTKSIEREKTPAEYAAEEQKRREAARLEEHDRFLTQTYPTEADLVRARDLQVQTLDERMVVTEKALDSADATLADLRSRKADADEPGAQAKLDDEVATFESTRREAHEAVAKIKLQRKELLARFTEDQARYEVIKPAPVPSPVPEPAPPTKGAQPTDPPRSP